MGIKSMIRRRLDDVQTIDCQALIEKIDQYDEVAFDVFDTLIKRDVFEPVDVFRLIEANESEPGFASKRIEAEKRARKNRREVTLEQIYDAYKDIDDLKRRQLMDLEIQYEYNLCVANKEMLPVYEYARKHKRVFIISDMYLSKEIIVGILNINGIDDFCDIIISNEVDKIKGDGSLFDYAVDAFKLKNAIYIGNKFISDYWMPRKHGLASEKVRTNTAQLSRHYKGNDNLENKCLRAFISNHNEKKDSYYYTVGFERFGPLLYGFVNWLYNEVIKDGVEEILFLSRDGYIMREAFKLIDWPVKVPHEYFEVSRRSLRVPLYCCNNDLGKLLDSVYKTASMGEILDGMGLDIKALEGLAPEYIGKNQEQLFKKEELPGMSYIHLIEQAALENSHLEYIALNKYLSQFDFTKKIAIVDIGWQGSMQRYLVEALKLLGVESNITGYYFGLSNGARKKLNGDTYKAKAYLFDCLHDESAIDKCYPFRTLFEYMFMQKEGSVKRYSLDEDRVIVERYACEYIVNGKPLPELDSLEQIQTGALNFVEQYNKSFLSRFIGYKDRIMFNYLYQTGIYPDKRDLNSLGDFAFFNNAQIAYLAKPGSIYDYLLHPKKLRIDESKSGWKTGFFKRLLKLPLPYDKIYMHLWNKMHR